ncbi:MAG: hypothetical protein EA392_09370 [Cryomorphaceae bacterium]|nr:MAG: hypothetical protein EA392_09370 [Cryomorphaceae bacterium]
MKFVILSFCSLFTFYAQAQTNGITLSHFEKQVRVNVADLEDAVLYEAHSNCPGKLQVDFTDKHFSGGCAGAIERTYEFSDACGNKLTESQYITLVDDTPPVFQNAPVDTLVASREEIPRALFVGAFDDGGQGADISFDEQYNFSDPDNVIITRTWTASDVCGNTATHTQQITVPKRK